MQQNMDSNHVVVEGFQTTLQPANSNKERKAGFFPLVFTVLSLHPSPNPNSSFFSVPRYKTSYELWINCDDFSRGNGGEIAAVDRLVDLMNIPFPLQGVPLFWKSFISKTRSETPVSSWGSMLAIMSDFLRDAAATVLQQEENGSVEAYPRVMLKITEIVKLPREELEKLRREANSNVDRVLNIPQTRMLQRMAAMQALDRVKFNGGDGDREAESCAICLMDLSASGSEVGRLPCSHCAHQSCILKWFMINNSCPFCRHEIPKAPTTDPYWGKPYSVHH